MLHIIMLAKVLCSASGAGRVTKDEHEWQIEINKTTDDYKMIHVCSDEKFVNDLRDGNVDAADQTCSQA